MSGGAARPNILLVTADQWRGDCLGAAGHPTLRTPHVDALAAEGAVFLNHYAACAPCSPARASIYTGLYQMNHRVVQTGAPLDDRFDNIARAARRAGYDPTLFGYTDTCPDPRTGETVPEGCEPYEGLLPGFATGQFLPENDGPWLDWLAGRGHDPAGFATIHQAPPEPGRKVSLAAPSYSAEETQTAFLAGRFLDWLGTRDDAPWFAHVSFLRPHPPFVVPAPYNTMYDPDTGPEFHRAPTPEQDAALHPLVAAGHAKIPTGAFLPGTQGLVSELSDADFRRIRALYYGMISEVDAQVGRMVEGLGRHGPNTLVIVTSDHAEMMGDRWLLGKGGFFPESYHLPLVISGPGVAPGTRVEALTSATDLFPTLLEITATQPLHAPDGRSLAPFLGGGTPRDWREAVTWEFDTGASSPARDTAMQVRMDAETLLVAACGMPDLMLRAGDHGPLLEDLSKAPGQRDRLLAATRALLDFRMRHADRTLLDR